MFILEKIYKLLATLVVASALFNGCSGNVAGSKTYENGKRVVDGGLVYPIKNSKTSSYFVNTDTDKGGFSYGRKPTQNEINAWNIDVMPDGTGAPEGQGSVELGDELFEAQCATCHGDFGIGNGGYPKMVGGLGSLKNQLLKPEEGDEPPLKSIGSYWPYASTLFWYIQSAMPYTHPKSLSNDETYALVAYLLMLNEIKIDGVELDDDYVLTKEKFLKIKMPNADGFYPNVDGGVGATEMTKYLADDKNYGAGTRCMSDCEVGDLIRIGVPLDDFYPAPSTVRDLPAKKSDGKEIPGADLYNNNCSFCHNAGADTPLIGDKDTWHDLMKKGLKKVYRNGIKGINGMPPKGGSSLSDKDFKMVVDYMIEMSK